MLALPPGTGAADLGKGPLPQGSGIVVMKLTPDGTVDWTRGFRAWFDTPGDPYDNPMDVLDLATDPNAYMLKLQWDGAHLWSRVLVVAFAPTLESRWVRVLGPMSMDELHLASAPEGVVVAGSLEQVLELDGTWYTPRSRRSDVLLLKLRK